jgi:CRISPR-associated protein (TIGR03986 family)
VTIPFHNPYNFVSTPDRKDIPEQSYAHDHNPVCPKYHENHSRYWADRYTGTVSVQLLTKTPLFITAPNSEKVDANGHRTYDCLDYIPATALKGMLSSAYEIITNSRYRVFSKKQHEKKLGYRTQTNANLVPGLMKENDGKWTITLFKGTSEIGEDGKANGPLYAAWLPCYQKDKDLIKSLEHGKEYKDVTLRRYIYNNPYTGTRFAFWSVEKIGELTLCPLTRNAKELKKTISVSGYVVKSGKIFPKKHDERFFFNDPQEETPLGLEKSVLERYENLLEDYRLVHAREMDKSKYGKHISSKQKLQNNSFVYAKTDGKTIEAIYPVQISRDLYAVSPWDCLDASLRPAENLVQLSPADRLFGWVAQEGKDAWKGKIRLSDGIYDEEGKSPVEKFDKSGPRKMAILGTPKPAQARFYLGDADGKPQENGLSKEQAGYVRDKKIRRRKVYLHHAEFKNEKIFPTDIVGSSQNRSITGWIPKDKIFTFKMRFENLTPEELGGLLTLLKLNEKNCCFRLGYGKPLGLGSVHLKIDDNGARIFTGEEIKKSYKTFDDLPTIVNCEKTNAVIKECIGKFEDCLNKAFLPGSNGFNPFEELIKSMQGVKGEIAYSVTHDKANAQQPIVKAPIYDWFIQNERAGNRVSLPSIGDMLLSYPPSKTLQKALDGTNKGNQARNAGQGKRENKESRGSKQG